ncbi:MAG: hypothetical protein DWI22_15080 [Planctomycetota bacterium]|nr:MAG: hypothetical protein DWI22_15080 [Planctomycetota bacterium]
MRLRLKTWYFFVFEGKSCQESAEDGEMSRFWGSIWRGLGKLSCFYSSDVYFRSRMSVKPTGGVAE